MVSRIRNSATTSASGNGKHHRKSLPSKALPGNIMSGSDHKYRGFFQEAVIGMFRTTKDGQFVDANDALARILGYESRDELAAAVNDIGRQVHVDPERRDEFTRLLEEHGSIKGFEAQVYRKDRTIIWLAISARALEPANAPARYEGIAEDITDRKAIEEALRSSEEWFYKAFHASPAAKSVVSSRDQRFVDVNDHFLAMLGYARDEVIGRSVEDLKMWVDLADRDRLGKDLEKTGIARNVDATLRAKDGSLHQVLGSAVVIHVDGELCVLTLLHDISERKQIEASLRDEQQRLGLAMEAGRMGTWEWDVATSRVQWSETLEALHGLAPGEFGGTFEDYLSDIHPDDREQVFDGISEALEFGYRDQEYRIIWPDGSEHWVAAKGQLVRDASGKPQRMIGLCMDVTERKRAEQAERLLSEASVLLAATTTDLQMTLANIARLAVPQLGDLCAVALVDERGEIKQAAMNHRNPRRMKVLRILEECYPFNPNEPMGVAKVLRTGEPEFYPHVPDALVKAAARDSTHLRLLRRLGIKSAMAVSLRARGQILGVLTLAITESSRRYTEADLAVAEELGRRAGLALDNVALYVDLKKALDAKDEFLGLMSHELRTPITTIYGGARMIRSRGDRLDEAQKDRLMTDIEQESERLFRMVEDLLALARVELGQKPTTEPLLMQRTVEAVAASFGQRRPDRVLELDIEQDLPPVAGQPVYVEQVLRNLLSNADKYSPAGLPIQIRGCRVEGGVGFSVVDRGPGVASEEMELIFNRFYRSSEATRRASGAGLGLTVCKRLIEAQDGNVWARPNEYGGLEVGFTLPLYKEDM